MKKHQGTIVILLSVLMGLLISVPVMALPTVSLNLIDSSINVGDLFEVEVLADGDDIGEELLSFGFDVSIDFGSFFSYDGYSLGPGLDDDSFGPGNVASSAFPGIPDDDVLLATLSFTALAEGTDTLTVKGIYDGMFLGLYYEFIATDILDSLDITVESLPIPEPATMLLLCTGLVGLFGTRQRFKK